LAILHSSSNKIAHDERVYEDIEPRLYLRFHQVVSHSDSPLQASDRANRICAGDRAGALRLRNGRSAFRRSEVD
jgi:hypothetical protein